MTATAWTTRGWGLIPEPELASLAELLEADDEDWQERALCAQTDPEAFFPEKGGSTREAKRICLSCEVRDECLEYALQHQERFGIWGGLSERERRKLDHRSLAADVPVHIGLPGGHPLTTLTPDEEIAVLALLKRSWGMQRIWREVGCSFAALRRFRDHYIMTNGEAA